MYKIWKRAIKKSIVQENTTVLFLIGFFFAILFVAQSASLRAAVSTEVYSPEIGDRIGIYNGQRVSQTEDLISLYDEDPENDIALRENIDLHGEFYYTLLAWFGAKTGWRVLKLFYLTQFAYMFLLVLFYPYIQYYMTRSFRWAVISPVFLYLLTRTYFFNHLSDTYWAPAWCVLFALPLIVGMTLADEWRLDDKLAAVLVIVVTIMANIVRPASAIGLLLSLLIVVIINIFRKSNIKIVLVAICEMGAYIFAEKILMFFLNLFIDIIPLGEVSPWHALWCGLGYYPNTLGYEWNDLAAFARAREVSPDVVLLSEEYNNILKMDYLKTLRESPLFIIKTYFNKLVEAMNYIFSGKSGMGLKFACVFMLLLLTMLIVKKKYISANITRAVILLFVMGGGKLHFWYSARFGRMSDL